MHCDFEAFRPVGANKQDTSHVVDIWKKCVDVQQHFNDLEMRIRNIAITVVGALIAAMSFTYQQGLEFNLFGLWRMPAGLGLVAAAVFAWIGFFLMDRFWYHILLRGAVAHAAKIENQFAATIPGIGLGTSISEASQGVRFLCIKLDSNRRLSLFYVVGFLMLAIIFIVLLFSETTKTKDVGATLEVRGQFLAETLASASK
jgi:hypothetical protein